MEFQSHEIIYYKKYPKLNMSEVLLDTEEISVSKSVDNYPSFEDVLQKISAATKLVRLPGREKQSQQFIETAIKLSHSYQLDTLIVRNNSHVTAEISFDGGLSMHMFKEIFVLADDFSFYTNIEDRDITISIDCYTHAVVRNGRIVMPPDITVSEE